MIDLKLRVSFDATRLEDEPDQVRAEVDSEPNKYETPQPLQREERAKL